jgi:Arc/MetJ family transcription regulator
LWLVLPCWMNCLDWCSGGTMDVLDMIEEEYFKPTLSKLRRLQIKYHTYCSMLRRILKIFQRWLGDVVAGKADSLDAISRKS